MLRTNGLPKTEFIESIRKLLFGSLVKTGLEDFRRHSEEMNGIDFVIKYESDEVINKAAELLKKLDESSSDKISDFWQPFSELTKAHWETVAGSLASYRKTPANLLCKYLDDEIKKYHRLDIENRMNISRQVGLTTNEEEAELKQLENETPLRGAMNFVNYGGTSDPLVKKEANKQFCTKAFEGKDTKTILAIFAEEKFAPMTWEHKMQVLGLLNLLEMRPLMNFMLDLDADLEMNLKNDPKFRAAFENALDKPRYGEKDFNREMMVAMSFIYMTWRKSLVDQGVKKTNSLFGWGGISGDRKVPVAEALHKVLLKDELPKNLNDATIDRVIMKPQKEEKRLTVTEIQSSLNDGLLCKLLAKCNDVCYKDVAPEKRVSLRK